MKKLIITVVMLLASMTAFADQEAGAMGPPQKYEMETFIAGTQEVKLDLFDWYADPQNFFCFSISCMTVTTETK